MRGSAKAEIEVKLRVASAAGIRDSLRRIGAVKLRRVLEKNTLFDTRNATFRKRGELVRIRIERPAPGPGGVTARLTFKGPSQTDRTFKVRSEMETPVKDPRLVMAAFRAMGLLPTFRYEKFRTTYRLNVFPGLHMELDETPIGAFLELEGPRRAIDRAARLLGFSRKDYITKSYLALYVEDCRRRGVAPKDFVFTSRKKVSK